MGNNDILFRLNAEDAGMADAVKVITRYSEQLETQLGKVTQQQKEHNKELKNFRELGELVFGSAGVIMGGVALLKSSLSDINGEITRIGDSFRNIVNLRTQAITATPMAEGVKFDQKFTQDRLTAYAEKLRKEYPAISPSMAFEQMRNLQSSTAGGYKPEEAMGLMSALGAFSNIQQFPEAMGIGAQLKKAYPQLSNDEIKAQVSFILKYAGAGRAELQDVKQAQFQELASFGISPETATQLVAAAASKFQTRKIQAFIEKMATPNKLLTPAESKDFQSFIDSGDVVNINGTYRPKIKGSDVSRAGEIATKYYLGDDQTRQSMLYGTNKDEFRRILFGSASDDTLKKVLLVKALQNMSSDARLNYVIYSNDETKRILLGDDLTVIKPALDLAKTLESPLAELKKDPKKFTSAYFASTTSPSTNLLAEAEAQKAKTEALDLKQGTNALTYENIKNAVYNRIRERMGEAAPNFLNYWLPKIQAGLAMNLSQAFGIQPETVGAIGETASERPMIMTLLEGGAGVLGASALLKAHSVFKMLPKSMKYLTSIDTYKDPELMTKIFGTGKIAVADKATIGDMATYANLADKAYIENPQFKDLTERANLRAWEKNFQISDDVWEKYIKSPELMAKIETEKIAVSENKMSKSKYVLKKLNSGIDYESLLGVRPQFSALGNVASGVGMMSLAESIISPKSDIAKLMESPFLSRKYKQQLAGQYGAESPETLMDFERSKRPISSTMEELGNIIGGFLYKGMVEVAKIIKEDKDVDISKKTKQALTNKMINDATLLEE